MGSMLRRDYDSLRFLIVEDQTITSIDLECILEDLGHTVVAVAGDPTSAQKAIDRNLGQIDVAIVDANLHGKSALSLTSDLKKHGIACAVTSGYTGDDLKTLGFREVHLEKPFTTPQVDELINRMKSKVRRPGTPPS